MPPMKVDAPPAAKQDAPVTRAFQAYRDETGQSLFWWALVALLNFITQIIFRREMHAGEFGTLNTALGMIGLMTIPVIALHQTFTLYLERPHDVSRNMRIEALRNSAFLVTETFAWIWGAFCVVLVFLLVPLLEVPRFSLRLFTLMNVLVAVGSWVSCAVCVRDKRLGLWAFLIVGAAVARLLVSAILTGQEPWAESGLAAFLIAGFVTLTPALQARETDTAARLSAFRAIWDRDFLICTGTTFSVLLALFLFSSADRIVAQSWFGVVNNNNMGMVNWPVFDSYQTAGLLARSLLWGTQPLLWILYAQRSPLTRTRAASLTFFWIYLAVLLLGAIVLGCIARPLSQLFCGDDFQQTALLVPSLAAAMIPLGLLQGLGIFALASKRHPECFVLGACSVGYTAVLYVAGRQPGLMPAYMFGAGLVSLMIVLFVGVVRWGRKQP